jgi:hypothetical protein
VAGRPDADAERDGGRQQGSGDPIGQVSGEQQGVAVHHPLLPDRAAAELSADLGERDGDDRMSRVIRKRPAEASTRAICAAAGSRAIPVSRVRQGLVSGIFPMGVVMGTP